MKIIKTIKNKIYNLVYGIMAAIAEFVHRYILELIILAFIFMGMCWAIGYFCNALYGMKFELQSCWGGFTAIGGAGVLASVKYCMDSWKNSPEGEAPANYGKKPEKKTPTQEAAALASSILRDYADGEDKKNAAKE